MSCNEVEENCNIIKIEENPANPLVGCWAQITSQEHRTDDIMIFTEKNLAWIGPKPDTLSYNYQYYLTKDQSQLFLYDFHNELRKKWKIEFDHGEITIMSVYTDNKWYIYKRINDLQL